MARAQDRHALARVPLRPVYARAGARGDVHARAADAADPAAAAADAVPAAIAVRARPPGESRPARVRIEVFSARPAAQPSGEAFSRRLVPRNVLENLLARRGRWSTALPLDGTVRRGRRRVPLPDGEYYVRADRRARARRAPHAGRDLDVADVPDRPALVDARSRSRSASASASSSSAARADVELGEHLVQVVLDGARADEQPRADLRVREPVAREPRDLGLLRGQLAARSRRCACGPSRPSPAARARPGRRTRSAPIAGEQLVRGAQLRAGVDAAGARAAATRRRAGGRARGPAARACGQPLDRLAVGGSAGLAVAAAARACGPRRPSAQSVPLAARRRRATARAPPAAQLAVAASAPRPRRARPAPWRTTAAGWCSQARCAAASAASWRPSAL